MRRTIQILAAVGAAVGATSVAGASLILAANFGGDGTAGAQEGKSVSVIDSETLTELARIPVGLRPQGIAIHPSGRWAYVGNRNDDNVSVIDLESFTLVDTLSIPGGRGLVVHPDGSRLYASHREDFTVFDIETNTVVTTFAFRARLAMHPDGRRLYAADTTNGTLTVFDTATNRVTARIPVPHSMWDLAIHPDGRTAYVNDIPPISKFSGGGVVSVIDLESNTLITTITDLPGSTNVAVHPNGRWLYLTQRDIGKFAVIDTGSYQIVAEITGLERPQGLAVDPSGRSVYVGSPNDAIIVIDTETNLVVGRVSTGLRPSNIAVFGSSCDLELVSDPSVDCNGNATPDECELVFDDCNGNGVLDTCELDTGTSADFNGDRTLDECQPQVTQLMDGAAGSFDATGATYVSPHAEAIPFTRFTLEATEDLQLLSVQSTYTGQISSGGRRGSGSNALPRVPTVSDFVRLGGGQHEVQIDLAPRPGEWLRLMLHVRGVSPNTTTFRVWLAHHPGDVNQDGVVDISDATAFGEEFRGRQSPELIDLNGDSLINVRDATTFGEIWFGAAGAPGWRGSRLPAKP